MPQPEEKEAWDYTYRLEAQVTDAARREMQGSASFVGTRGNIAAETETDRYVYQTGETAHVKVKTADYENHPVAAHVTLGRVRAPRRQPALTDALAGSVDFGRLRVDRVALMRSELSPRGARYSELAAAPLAVQ